MFQPFAVVHRTMQVPPRRQVHPRRSPVVIPHCRLRCPSPRYRITRWLYFAAPSPGLWVAHRTSRRNVIDNPLDLELSEPDSFGGFLR